MDKNTPLPSDSVKRGTPQAQAAAADHSDGPEPTVGGVIHNEITYRGVDWLLNSTVGVATTYWSARTESGQKYFQKPVSNFFRRILTPILKTESKIAEGSRWGSMFTSIIVGGMAIIPIMVGLENKKNKKGIIRWFDERIYGKEIVETDPHFKEAYDAIDHEPKKDFSTGMAARIAVLIPMIAATIIPDVNKGMVKYLYNPIATGSKALCRVVGLQPKKLMERGMMEVADGDISKGATLVSDWDFIHRTIGFDFGLTFIYAYAHELAYKAFAALRHNHKMKKNGENPSPSRERGREEADNDVAPLLTSSLKGVGVQGPEPQVTIDHLAGAQQPALQMEHA